MAEFSKTTFNLVDLTKIIALLLCFVGQHYSLKNEIHDAVSVQKTEKQVVSMQFAILNKSIDALENKYNSLIGLQMSPADKPKPIKIETE